MEIVTLNCGNCGAPLRVPRRLNFVTCGHCRSQFLVRRTDSSIATERINRLDSATAELSEHIAELSYHQALERLDDQWEEERRRYVARTREGREITPELVALSWLALAVLGAVGLMAAILLGRSDFIVVGALMNLVAIPLFFIANQRRLRYRRAYEEYRERREQLRPSDFLPKKKE